MEERGRSTSWAQRILQGVRLTHAGRLQLQVGEVECQLLDGVDIEGEFQDELVEPLRSGLVTLTTVRIVWVDEQSRSGFCVPLSSICRVWPPKKGIKNMFATPRLRLQLWICANGKLFLQGAAGADSSVTLALVFRGHGNFDSFVLKLAELMQSKPWEALPAPSAAAASSSSLADVSEQPSRWNPSRAGVSGILRKEQEQWEEADKNLHEAFQDLNALMSKAKEMVLLADKMRAKLLSAQSTAEDGDDLGSKQEIQDWLLSVGIASPVTKESAGALYHQQLSRQLADFVWSPLQRAGGTLAMVDVYCLFNRARGTELISPEDLLQACVAWERIDVPVRMRRFDSGALVIQTKSESDDEVFSRIMLLIERSENEAFGVSASEAARSLGVAPTLAKEYLIAAENTGLLCRDDGADGLRFFANLFKDVDVTSVFA